MAPRDQIAGRRPKSMFKDGTTTTAFTGNYFPFIDELDLALTPPKTTTFISHGLILSNDGGVEDLEISFDGIGVHGKVRTNEVLTFTHRNEQEIWIRSASGGVNFRFWAW